jgi:hypothetical protein
MELLAAAINYDAPTLNAATAGQYERTEAATSTRWCEVV